MVLWQKLFYLLLMFVPFSFALNPSSGIDLSLIRILVPIIFILWFFDSLKNKHLQIDKRPRFWFLVLFLFLCVISYFWAVDQSRALRKIIFLLNFFPLYFPAYSIFKSEKSLLALKLIFWSAFTAALLGIFQFLLQFIIGIDPTLNLFSKYISPFFLGENFSKEVLARPSWLVNIGGKTLMRAFGSFPDPHLFALYLNMTLPIGLYLAITASKNNQKSVLLATLDTRLPCYATHCGQEAKSRFIGIWTKTHSFDYLTATLTILLASLLAFSRAAYLSLLAMGIFFILTSSRKKIIIKFPTLSLLTVLAVVVLLIIPNPLLKRFTDSFNLKEGSASGRMEMLKRGYEMTLDYPLTGVGIGNFSRYIQPTSKPRDPIYAHNLLLDFSSETGIPATFILLLVVLSPIFYYFKNKNLFSKSIAAAFIVFLVHSMFETPVYSINVLPLFLILLSANTQ